MKCGPVQEEAIVTFRPEDWYNASRISTDMGNTVATASRLFSMSSVYGGELYCNTLTNGVPTYEHSFRTQNRFLHTIANELNSLFELQNALTPQAPAGV